MRILFFTENIHRGGLDSFLVSLINHWPVAEDEIFLLCNASHPGLDDIKYALTRQCVVIPHYIPLYTDLSMKFHKNILFRALRRFLSPILKYSFFGFYIVRLRGQLLQNKPNRLFVVNGGHPGGDSCRAAVLSWSLFARRLPKAIYNFHNLAVAPRWFEKWPERLIDAFVIGQAKAIIGVSQACALSLQTRINSESMSKISWIYNGIPAPSHAQKVNRISLRESLGLPSDALICLLLATYEVRKGHDFLLKAFKKVILKVPTARLVICGHGYPEQIEEVHRLVKDYSLSDRVILQNFRRDTDFLFSGSDLLLVASQSYESFSLTSVEAMAHRLPVVATCVGGVPEVVLDGEGGFCVDPNNINDYAARIIELLGDPDLRSRQGEAGFLRYKRLFTAERMAKEYSDMIHM